MLRVFGISGDQLVSVALEDAPDARSLKRRLQKVCGVPRFRQRLLHGGVPLEDGVKLETPMDLQLLLLPLTGTTASDVHLFVDAVRTKGAEEIEEMLSKGQDANVVEFWTPLKYAAQQGRADVVQLLLEANAEADGKTDQTRRTPLWAASQAGHVEAVRLLLEARAAHNVQDSPEGRTPLFVATEEGHYEVMRVLLEAGADRDLRSSRGRTPLHQACVDLEAMDLLVKARADIAKADQNGETPLTKACRVNSVAAMRLLLEACPEQPKSGALSAASGLGFTELLGLLLDARASPALGDLRHAALYGSPDVVRLLLEARADLNDGALGCACALGRAPIVQLLLSARADPHQVPLASCRTNEEEIVRLLSEKRQEDGKHSAGGYAMR